MYHVQADFRYAFHPSDWFLFKSSKNTIPIHDNTSYYSFLWFVHRQNFRDAIPTSVDASIIKYNLTDLNLVLCVSEVVSEAMLSFVQKHETRHPLSHCGFTITLRRNGCNHNVSRQVNTKPMAMSLCWIRAITRCPCLQTQPRPLRSERLEITVESGGRF